MQWVVSQCLGCAILIKNADIATGNTYASISLLVIIISNNMCLLVKVGVLIVLIFKSQGH